MERTRTIANQVTEMSAQQAAAPPNEAMSTFARDRARLATVPIPDGVLGAGAVLTDVELLDAHGAGTRLSIAVDGRAAVLVFYRGAWCPYCNLALRTYQQQLLPELQRRGVELIAISPQRPDGSLTMAEKNSLSFAVLSDPGNQLGAQLGIVTRPADEVLETQRRVGLDLLGVNADGTADLPMPTTVIVEGDLRIRWIDVHPDYGTRSETSTILAALDG